MSTYWSVRTRVETCERRDIWKSKNQFLLPDTSSSASKTRYIFRYETIVRCTELIDINRWNDSSSFSLYTPNYKWSATHVLHLHRTHHSCTRTSYTRITLTCVCSPSYSLTTLVSATLLAASSSTPHPRHVTDRLCTVSDLPHYYLTIPVRVCSGHQHPAPTYSQGRISETIRSWKRTPINKTSYSHETRSRVERIRAYKF